MRNAPDCGTVVYWHQYDASVRSGTVLATRKSPLSSKDLVAIATSDSYEVKETEQLFAHEYECRLDLAQRKQQEAARLLQDAAELFKQGLVSQQAASQDAP